MAIRTKIYGFAAAAGGRPRRGLCLALALCLLGPSGQAAFDGPSWEARSAALGGASAAAGQMPFQNPAAPAANDGGLLGLGYGAPRAGAGERPEAGGHFGLSLPSGPGARNA